MVTVYVGDMHVTRAHLPECTRVIDLVKDTACKYRADRVVFLGDQLSNHGVAHADEVLFWSDAISVLSQVAEIILLTGNHDTYVGAVNNVSFFSVFIDKAIVVTEPKLFGNALFLPYMDDNDAFVGVCRSHKTDLVVCHQDFIGAMMDNGVKSPYGADMDAIAQPRVVSGHIHTPQRVGKVFYAGSPRWCTGSGTNGRISDRWVWVDNGVEVIPVSTAEIVRRMVWIDVRENAPLPDVPEGADVRVDIYGTSAFIEDVRGRYVGCTIRTFRDDGKVAKVRESDGVGVAFRKFLSQYSPPHRTPVSVLEAKAEQHGL